MGLFDTDYLYEEESVREKRLMRGLTRRLHDVGNSKPSKLGISTKVNRVGSPKKKLGGSPKRRNYVGRRASSIGSKGSDKSNVNLGLIG